MNRPQLDDFLFFLRDTHKHDSRRVKALYDIIILYLNFHSGQSSGQASRSPTHFFFRVSKKFEFSENAAELRIPYPLKNMPVCRILLNLQTRTCVTLVDL